MHVEDEAWIKKKRALKNVITKIKNSPKLWHLVTLIIQYGFISGKMSPKFNPRLESRTKNILVISFERFLPRKLLTVSHSTFKQTANGEKPTLFINTEEALNILDTRIFPSVRVSRMSHYHSYLFVAGRFLPASSIGCQQCSHERTPLFCYRT